MDILFKMILLNKVFDVMRTKLGSAVEATPEEIANSESPNKFTILMILDKIYALFKCQSLKGNLNRPMLTCLFVFIFFKTITFLFSSFQTSIHLY